MSKHTQEKSLLNAANVKNVLLVLQIFAAMVLCIRVRNLSSANIVTSVTPKVDSFVNISDYTQERIFSSASIVTRFTPTQVNFAYMLECTSRMSL